MSLYTWNSYLEHSHLLEKIDTINGIACYFARVKADGTISEMDGSFSSSDDEESSISSFELMSSLEEIGDVDDDLFDEDSDDELDILEPMVVDAVEQAACIYSGIENEDIKFGQHKRIADFTRSECIKNFCFCKDELVEVADALWPLVAPHLSGDHEKCQLQNKYVAPYETCFLVYLFKLS